jgi:hypothetical protein
MIWIITMGDCLAIVSEKLIEALIICIPFGTDIA